MKYNVGQIIPSPHGDDGYSHVPNWIFGLALSDQARLLLAWAAGRPKGWVPMVKDIQQALGFGKDKWRRLVAELQPFGVIAQMRAREDGRTTHSLTIDLRPLCPQPAQNQAIASEGRVLRNNLRKSVPSRDVGKTQASEKEEFRTKKTSGDACGRPGKKLRAKLQMENLAGWQVRHADLGLLTVCGGDTRLWAGDAGPIAGAASVRIWESVERGELALQPPVPKSTVGNARFHLGSRDMSPRAGSRGPEAPWPTILAQPKCSGLRAGMAGEVEAP